jgi:thiol-disulfide isomerase/thioredoxin
VFLVFIPPAAHAADPKPLAIGSPAPDFDLPGVDGKDHKLSDFKDAKLLCVIFTCNHCPTAQAYDERLKKLHADYKDKGVAIVAISPNDPLALRLDELGYTEYSDSLDEMKLRAKDQGFELPLRRRDAEGVAGVRGAGDPARVSLRRGAEAALPRPDR